MGRLQRLAVFEAAARLGSFTRAAEELGLTQPGVTRHVRALESALGVSLFERSANRAVLSAAGMRLQDALSQGFGTIESGLERIGAETTTFVLAANPGVAQRWLVPHLDGLQAAIGDRDLRLWLFDRNAEIAAGTFDAAIHAGSGSWPGTGCLLLFPEIVLPVATPELAARLGLDASAAPGRLLHQALLQLDELDRPWMSWTSWLAHHGLELPPGASRVRYNNYALVLQEAVAGRGIALAWRYLVDDLLAAGQLVPVGPEVRHPTCAYYLIWPERQGGETVQRLAAWIQALIANSGDPAVHGGAGTACG